MLRQATTTNNNKHSLFMNKHSLSMITLIQFTFIFRNVVKLKQLKQIQIAEPKIKLRKSAMNKI